MKLVSFQKDDQSKAGVLINDLVVDLKAATQAQARTAAVPASLDDMISLLDSGDAGLKAAGDAVAFATGRAQKGDLSFPLDRVKLLAPLPRPRKLFCLAENYTEHIEEGGKVAEEKDKITPKVFMKPSTNTVVGPGEPILISKAARAIDWEGELAVVIGRKGKHIPREKAFDHIAGYTALNDVSERDFKIKERPESSEWDSFFDWLNGKWFDAFAPMGPCLVTRDEIPDPHQLTISLGVNGREMQNSSTANMIHKIDEVIEYLSTFLTLEPGDVIATGTPSGTGEPQGIFLKPGDVVRLEIEKIGVLENPVEAE